MGSSFVRYFYVSLTFLHWCMHIGWNGGSVWCSFSSFCARPGVLHDKGQILFFSLLHLLSCSEILIQTLFLCDCSSELFEQLLFWGACFRFSYLCACVVLQPRYNRTFIEVFPFLLVKTTCIWEYSIEKLILNWEYCKHLRATIFKVIRTIGSRWQDYGGSLYHINFVSTQWRGLSFALGLLSSSL